jgi:anti-sigma factor RsiW
VSSEGSEGMTQRAEDFPCSRLVELVTDYLEGTLDPELREIVDEHLEICEGCTTYLDQMRTTIALTGHLREDDVSPAMQADLVRAFRALHENPPVGDR